MKGLEKVYKRNNDMVSREIDNEMILMPIYKASKHINEMYTLSDTAAAMWQLVDGSRTLGEIVDELCAKHEGPRETIENDLEELVKDMKEIKAIE